MKKRLLWVTHPVTLIVAVHLAWTAALVYWILFFLDRYRQIQYLAERSGAASQNLQTWAPFVVGILLMVAIFGGLLALTLMLAKQAIVNRQMRDFLSYVSHELRTPLTSISLSLETLRDRDLTEEQRRMFIDAMLEDTERLSHQIGGILQASRLRRRRQPLRKALIGLDAFVKSFVARHKLQVNQGGHRLEVGRTDYCTVLGDGDALETVLENLVQNAERYSPRGTTIVISLEKDGKWARLSVSDEGIGIARKELRRIFNLFYRTEGGQKESRRGSGLGLYIVKGIISLHHGKVQAFSEGAGKGSRFDVLLPLVTPEGGQGDEGPAGRG